MAIFLLNIIKKIHILLRKEKQSNGASVAKCYINNYADHGSEFTIESTTILNIIL